MEKIAELGPEVQENIAEYRAYALKQTIDCDHIQENFEKRELQTEEVKRFEDSYRQILLAENTFLGLGNNAFVFSAVDRKSAKTCHKFRWNFISVANKSKKTERLPKHVQKLKHIANHFEEVKSKTRALITKGWDKPAQNDPLTEAVLNNYASYLLEKAGFGKCVPRVARVLEREYQEDGLCAPGDPYSVVETMYSLQMDQVNGRNIEEIILEASFAETALIKCDELEEKLTLMLKTLHQAGLSHGDISTRNIMIDSEGNPWIIDFGTAHYHQTNNSGQYEKDLADLKSVLKSLRAFVRNPKEGRRALREKINEA